jgi:hypothetical protein
VSAKDFQRYYRALQDLVFEGKRNRTMRAHTLELYRWVTLHRQGEKANEPWESTMAACVISHEHAPPLRQFFSRGCPTYRPSFS